MTKSFEELGHATVCSSCVHESFLRGEINRTGEDAICFYCGTFAKSWTLEMFAESIRGALRDHYELTATGPSTFEYAMGHPWERTGEPVSLIISELAGIDDCLTSDVRKFLDDLHGEFGEDGPYAEDAHYARSQVEDEDQREAWGTFERSLKATTRYFNEAGRQILSDVFAGIEDHRNGKGNPVIIEAGPNRTIDSLFRARVFQSEQSLLFAMEKPDFKLGPPPPELARAGRMNAYGISVFYGALEKQIALREVRPHVGSLVLMARFPLLRTLNLLDVEALRSVEVSTGSFLDPTYIKHLRRAKFLKALSRRISQPVQPEDEPLEYLATQAIVDFLATQTDLDGMIYSSAQGGKGLNVVLFHKAARVQILEVGEGQLIKASSSCDEDSEIQYFLTKTRGEPSVETRPPSSIFDDRRTPALYVDLSSLEVHSITEVQPQAYVLPVKYEEAVQETPF